MKSFANTVIKIAEVIDSIKDRKVICITGDLGLGKSTVCNYLDKILNDVVYINADMFRKVYKVVTGDELADFILSYDFEIIQKEIEKFLKGEDFGIYYTRDGVKKEKLFSNGKAKVLLIEFPFIHACRDRIKVDMVINIDGNRNRTSSGSKISEIAEKAMKIYKEKFRDKADIVIINE